MHEHNREVEIPSPKVCPTPQTKGGRAPIRTLADLLSRPCPIEAFIFKGLSGWMETLQIVDWLVGHSKT